jgi:hypothetical protein
MHALAPCLNSVKDATRDNNKLTTQIEGRLIGLVMVRVFVPLAYIYAVQSSVRICALLSHVTCHYSETHLKSRSPMLMC